MLLLFRRAASLLICWIAVPLAVAEPVPVIFDTDMGSDYDDAGALAVLHALADRGEAEILAMASSNHLAQSVRLIAIINQYYGRAGVPIGAIRGPGRAIDTWHSRNKWTEELPAKYPAPAAAQPPAAVDLYRKTLAGAPDGSVVIITVGFFTNLRDLLQSGSDVHSALDGKELVRAKVARVVSMAGKFPEGKETNIIVDAPSAKEVFAAWPTEIVISGYEIGRHVRTGEKLVARGETGNPVADAYRVSMEVDRAEKVGSRYEPGGRASYDQTAVLAAVRDPARYFGTERGTLEVLDGGKNRWQPGGAGKHVRLLEKMPPAELAVIIEDLMMAVPRIPAGGQ